MEVGPWLGAQASHPPPLLETVQLGDAVADPMRQMRLREHAWGAVWRSPALDEAKLEEWLRRTAERAKEEELPRRTAQSARQALVCISPKKAMGVGALRSSDVARLPDEAAQE